MTKQHYMYITNSPDQFWIESYTRYITTVEGFADMVASPKFFEDMIDMDFQEVTHFSLTPPDDNGYIKVLVTGVSWCHEVETVERGLIPVNVFK